MLVHRRQLEWIVPNWPVPSHVRALVSTRKGCLSHAPYDGFNTASHVGDNPKDVARCRRYFQQRFNIQTSPQWLDQVHGVDVIEAEIDNVVRTADACFSRSERTVCTLHTADCLPVFFSNKRGTQVALAHAGWRGLAAGVLENTLKTFPDDPKQIVCWLGPAISQHFFEVGAEVKVCFEQSQFVPQNAFKPSGRKSTSGEHYYCDLYALAKERLFREGVELVCGGDFCTFQDSRFFSYRQAPQTGRILSAVWIQPSF